MTLFTLASGSPESHVLPHVFKDWGKNLFDADVIPVLNIALKKEFYFTNHLLMTLVSAGLCLAIFPLLASRYAAHRGNPQAPRGFMNLFESLLEFVRKGVAEPVLKERTDRFMPYLWTTFFFILFCNLLGMIPLDSIIALFTGGRVQGVGGTATGNLAVTGGLAICAFLMIHVSGTVEVFKGLIAGTYGHHAHHDEHADGGGHGEHEHAKGGRDHGHNGGHQGQAHGHAVAPPTAAVCAAPMYLWNFAPHVFASHDPQPKPPLGLRAVMVPIYAVLLMYAVKFGLGLFGATAGDVGQWMGLVFGIVAGFNAKGVKPMDFADALMWCLLLILELLGAVIKPFALMIRLFANMVAGHIVLASILALIPVVSGIGALSIGIAAALGCTALSCLELFVAFLQAYIFTFLTTLFLGMSVAPEH